MRLAEEIRYQYEEGELNYLNHLIDAYHFAATQYTWNGKTITAEQLKNSYDTAKHRQTYEKLDKQIIPAEQ